MKNHFLTQTKAGAAIVLVAILGTFITTAAEAPKQTKAERKTGVFTLSAEQQQLYRTALQQYRGELGKLGERYQRTSRELVEATLSENFSEKAVREKAAALGKVHAEMISIRAKALANVAPSLKPEQREQLVERFGMEILYGRMDRGRTQVRGRPAGR